MKTTSLVLLLTFCTLAGKAQTAEDSVKAVVNKMFLAMKNSDSASIADCFAAEAILQTITRDKKGRMMVRSEQVNDFARIVGSMPKNAADERIVFDVLKVDGPLATAWTPYKFYFNGNFSHCGSNSFQLVRLQGAWKIQYLIDTRRKQGCE